MQSKAVQVKVEKELITINIPVTATPEAIEKEVIKKHNETYSTQIKALKIFILENKKFIPFKGNVNTKTELCGIPICANIDEILMLKTDQFTHFMLPQDFSNPLMLSKKTLQAKEQYGWICTFDETPIKEQKMPSQIEVYKTPLAAYTAAKNRLQKDLKVLQDGAPFVLASHPVVPSIPLLKEKKLTPPTIIRCELTHTFYLWAKNKQGGSICFEAPEQFNKTHWNDERLQLTDKTIKHKFIEVTKQGSFGIFFSAIQMLFFGTKDSNNSSYKVSIKELETVDSMFTPETPWIVHEKRTGQYLLCYQKFKMVLNNPSNMMQLISNELKTDKARRDWITKYEQTMKNLSSRDFNPSWEIMISPQENPDLFEVFSTRHCFFQPKKMHVAAVALDVDSKNTFHADNMTDDQISKHFNNGKIQIAPHEYSNAILHQGISADNMIIYQKNNQQPETMLGFDQANQFQYNVLAYQTWDEAGNFTTIIPNADDEDYQKFLLQQGQLILSSTEVLLELFQLARNTNLVGRFVPAIQADLTLQIDRISISGICWDMDKTEHYFSFKIAGKFQTTFNMLYPNMDAFLKTMPMIEKWNKIFGGANNDQVISLEFVLKRTSIPTPEQEEQFFNLTEKLMSKHQMKKITIKNEETSVKPANQKDLHYARYEPATPSINYGHVLDMFFNFMRTHLNTTEQLTATYASPLQQQTTYPAINQSAASESMAYKNF